MGDEKRILVIDDEEVIHTSLKRILTKQGYEVDNSLTVKDAFSKLDENDYDLIITDLMMPEMNGIELLEELKAKEIKIPSLMITGYPTIKTAVQATRLGAVDYVSKPFTRKEILGGVNRALRRQIIGVTDITENEAQESREVKQSGGTNIEVTPGDKFFLPGHSWAHYLRNGTIAIGVEDSFLKSIGEIVEIEAPEESSLLEQGLKSISLKTADEEEHFVFAPVSGRVIQVNDEIIKTPGDLTWDEWLLKILPSQLNDDLLLLRKKT